jgi:hypothetical protein
MNLALPSIGISLNAQLSSLVAGRGVPSLGRLRYPEKFPVAVRATMLLKREDVAKIACLDV